ncbi:hypothetical protein GCM10009665_12140 [Kitasatospora nipponensis]|uniref:NlpC/P60 domain-containing protein n=1 Tax=Kitasatospora nipponensis TaxID=258049 RepID=A0ABN1VU77_9ACTN
MVRRLLPTLLLTLAGTAAMALTPIAGPAAARVRPASAAPARTALAGAAVAAAGLVRPADDPPAPGGNAPSRLDDEVARARAEADHRAVAAAGIEARLAGARVELDQAGRVAEQAVEAFDGAQVRLDRASAEASAAATRSAAAQAARAEAAEDAASLAAATYRLGTTSELSAISVLLGVDGPRAASEQAVAVGAAGATSREILDAATSTAAAEAAADQAAAAATDEAQRAAIAVDRARVEAQTRLTAQQVSVIDLGRRREHLLSELATARRTTVELERQRQAAREEAAARQAEEAAKAAAAAAAAAAEAAAAKPPAPDATATAAPNSPGAAWSEEGAGAALAFARSKLGLPYIWGGEGPVGYDCSGLTMLAWQQSGKRLTHFAADQYAESTPVTYPQLRPGDLVFWTHTGRAADIYHVAIYLGDDRMIEAPRTGVPIKEASLWIMGPPDFYARP